MTGAPLDDAYPYVDWPLAVRLLSIEIILARKLHDAEFSSKSWSLGLTAALTIAAGYYGELAAIGDLSPGWSCWFLSMILFCRIVHELQVWLASAIAQESDPEIRGMTQTVQVMTVVSWRLFGEGDLSNSRPKQSHSSASSLRRWRRCLPRTRAQRRDQPPLRVALVVPLEERRDQQLLRAALVVPLEER